MRPAVVDRVLIDKVCTLLVMVELVSLEPECVWIRLTLLHITRDAEHLRVGNLKTTWRLTLSETTLVSIGYVLACYFGSLVRGDAVNLWNSTRCFWSNLHLTTYDTFLAVIIDNNKVVCTFFCNSKLSTCTAFALCNNLSCNSVLKFPCLCSRNHFIKIFECEFLVWLNHRTVSNDIAQWLVVSHSLIVWPNNLRTLLTIRRNGTYTETALALVSTWYHWRINNIGSPWSSSSKQLLWLILLLEVDFIIPCTYLVVISLLPTWFFLRSILHLEVTSVVTTTENLNLLDCWSGCSEVFCIVAECHLTNTQLIVSRSVLNNKTHHSYLITSGQTEFRSLYCEGLPLTLSLNSWQCYLLVFSNMVFQSNKELSMRIHACDSLIGNRELIVWLYLKHCLKEFHTWEVCLTRDRQTWTTPVSIIEGKFCLCKAIDITCVYLISTVSNPPTPCRHIILCVEVIPLVVECNLAILAEAQTITKVKAWYEWNLLNSRLCRKEGSKTVEVLQTCISQITISIDSWQ